MWRVCRRTRKDDDYTNYKEALNAATNEIRQSKITVFTRISAVNQTYETRFDH